MYIYVEVYFLKRIKLLWMTGIAITVVCPISDVQLKILRKLFKLPVNSSAAVNSLENYGPVNSLSVKNVKQ
jgi:hypothetical protein